MQRKEVEKNYIKKIKELKEHNKAYFDKDEPIISDSVYDKIKQEILDLEKKYKYLNNKDSPSKRVG
jgi:DNA ligase (NAD+)